MSVQPYKIIALIKKDIKDLRRNSSFLLMVCMSVFFTALYRYMKLGGEQMPSDFVLSIGVLMTLCMVPISVTAMNIAEEKEKNTLRTLMLSNVSATEFLLSKAIVIFIMTQLVCILSFIIAGGAYVFATFLAVTAITCICLMFFGATVGIVSKNQMSTGVLASPLTMLMLMPAIFGQVDESIAKFAQFVPTYAMLQLLQGTDRTLFFLAVIFCWIVLAAILFIIAYQKKQLDA